jgi:hypothetical protein
MPPEHNRTIRAILLRAAIVGAAIVVALLVGEATLRAVRRDRQGFRPTNVPATRTSVPYLPDFRDRPRSRRKAAGTFRILVIGDSFAWGAGVHSDDAFPDRLQRRVDRLGSERRIEVVNWSRPGWNTSYEWKVTGYRLPRLQPDLIVIGFCLNDAEPSGERRHELQHGVRRRKLRSAWARSLARHSVLFETLAASWENVRQTRAVRAYYPTIFADEESWGQCVRALGRFQDYAVEHRIPLLVMVFPVFDGQVDEEYPYRAQHLQLEAAAAERGIAVLDLLRAFEGMDTRRLAVVPFTDPHPDEIAHRIAADELFDYLMERRWLPVEAPSEAPVTVETSERGGGD